MCAVFSKDSPNSTGMLMLLFSFFPVTTGRTAHWDCCPKHTYSFLAFCQQDIIVAKQSVGFLFINILFSPTNKYYICKEMYIHFSAWTHIWRKDFFGFVGHLQRRVSTPALWVFARMGNLMSSWSWRIANGIDHSFPTRPAAHCKGDK